MIKIPIENQEGVQPLPAPLTRGDGSIVRDLTSVLPRERCTERFPCKDKVIFIPRPGSTTFRHDHVVDTC